MAIQFDKCLFEILAKLTTAELSAVCSFIDNKADILQRQVDKILAYEDSTTQQLLDTERAARTAQGFLDQAIAGSALLGTVRTLGPACGSIADIFQGAVFVGDVAATVFADATYIIRQITTRAGLLQAIKNEASDLVDGLRDLCGMLQLLILQKSQQINTKGSISPTTDFFRGN